MNRIREATLVTALALTLGCHEQTRPEPEPAAPAQAAQPAPTAPASAPAPSQANAASEEKPEAPGCATPVHGGAPEAMTVGKLRAVRTGTTLTFNDPDSDGVLNLGVLGPINEGSGENLIGLRRYEQFFQKNKVDAIVVTGDVGEVAQGIQTALEELGRTQLPVFVVIGNRECRGDYTEGVHAAQAHYPNVVNLNDVREVVLPGATLVSLPGYHDPNYINCDTGCRYTQKNLDEVVAMAEAAHNPVVLVSHGPPRGEGTQAIDYAESAGNVGDPALGTAIERAHIPFGLFSNIKEAGARATDLAGTTLVPQDKLVRALYLNPGPAGVEDWRMNGGSTGHGFAAVLSIKGDEASWKLFEGKKLTPAERQQARKLAAESAASEKSP